MRQLCDVPGCLRYASSFRLMTIRRESGDQRSIPSPADDGTRVALSKSAAADPDRHYVGFCPAHAKLGPFEQRRLL